MFSLYLSGDKDTDDKAVLDYLSLLLEEGNDSLDAISTLSNISALLKWYIPRINWLGFYLVRGKELVLGPFQGEPACTLIPFSKGVCGKCARDKKTVIVEDVELFPDHIACSSASKSEIVVPLIKNERLYGVIDVDSPEKNRFDRRDASFLEKTASLISNSSIPEYLKELCKRE